MAQVDNNTHLPCAYKMVQFINMEHKNIDYKKRLEDALKSIIEITKVKRNEKGMDRIQQIAEAQLKNLESVINKDTGQGKV